MIDLDCVPEDNVVSLVHLNTEAAKQMSVYAKEKVALLKGKPIKEYHKLLMTDTSKMTEKQLEKHEIFLAQMVSLVGDV